MKQKNEKKKWKRAENCEWKISMQIFSYQVQISNCLDSFLFFFSYFLGIFISQYAHKQKQELKNKKK